MHLPSVPRRVLVCAVAVPVLVLVGAGCSTTQTEVKGQLEVATGQVVSAGRSATLALSQYQAGKTLGPATDTALEDALTDIASEQSAATSLETTTPQQRALQQRTTRALDRVAEAVSGARSALQQASPGRLREARQDVRTATDGADGWATELGKGAP
ncbi:hypothetical protein GCM10017714_25570 [Curtobacterium pusillum]|uniref:Lipoprotein n=1 Tax=Curtobacterium pusillum TaxID=69373 RepID=A0AAW3T443_9MICO|nr:hypothetical protein [Curtobacterium pusillum]MBA8989370.1 hypothetical protein [Curtobacterium pusillum]NUU15593.1 hypothetical protein [Curtobacterium pusillum]GLK32687.1 hypothetical protein GCM10017610_29720 [Curtobacterium pusillum]